MATITAAITSLTSLRSVLITWEAMGNADTGTAVDSGNLSDKYVTATGSFGGATVTLQGSNDNVTFVTLQDTGNADITFGADGGNTILDNPRFLRAITAGGTATDVDVIVHALQ